MARGRNWDAYLCDIFTRGIRVTARVKARRHELDRVESLGWFGRLRERVFGRAHG